MQVFVSSCVLLNGQVRACQVQITAGERRSIGVLNFEHGVCKATDAAELCPAGTNCIVYVARWKQSRQGVSVLVGGVPAEQESEANCDVKQKSENCFSQTF
jgi:hypothetical protein